MMRNNVAYMFPLGFGAAPSIAVMATPTAGFYYQVKKGDTPWKIANTAYVDSGLLTAVKTGLFLLNDNPANAHIQKGTSGWESYKVKGLQLNPKYAPGDASAAHGSGTAYPLLWVPPTDGRTPDQMGGGSGPAGPQGNPGQKGDKGDKGDPGHTPTAAEIKKLISDFMDQHPVAGKVSAADLAAAVADHLAKNPVAQGERGPQGIPGEPGPAGPPPGKETIKALIAEFMDENPVAGKVSAADLAAAVSDHLAKNPPIAQGARGPQGIPGEPGPAGPPPTTAQIAQGISDYMKANPVPSGGSSGFDMDQARDFVDARIRVALRNYKPESTGTADFDLASMGWQHAAMFVIGGMLGAALLNGLQQGKKHKLFGPAPAGGGMI
jgi:hypothetical protein